MYRVIALDPGGTTGWATYTAERMVAPSGSVEYYHEKWACGQIGPDEHHKKLWTLLEMQRTSEYTVVCESFEFRRHDNHRDNVELISREYIGLAKLYASIWPQVDLKMQTAAQAKGFIPDKGPQANKKIKEAGLWYPSSVHVMDATRHLLYYLVNRVGRLDLVERWWKPKL